ncbi:TatD family hydrolase [Larsenimonas rhizosphaerae]|nr:TatD family hydrolase [Larsenimonas rhizosphaerae]
MIDAHCHLSLSAFDVDLEEVKARARCAGIMHMIDAGTTADRFKRQCTLAADASISICHGLHPWFLDVHRIDTDAGHNDLDCLERMLGSGQAVAVGECGLDRRMGRLDEQWSLLNAQLRLAKTHDLPVVLHCVGMNDELSKRLREMDLPRRGLIHAFSGSWQQARRLLDLGYLLGVGGAMTHPGAHRLHRVVAALPDDGFVLETDSPDMQPAGITGRNEPSHIVQTCRKAAELRHVSADTLSRYTADNTTRLFRL